MRMMRTTTTLTEIFIGRLPVAAGPCETASLISQRSRSGAGGRRIRSIFIFPSAIHLSIPSWVL